MLMILILILTFTMLRRPGDVGTVGAVAVDTCGHVSSATSTGGINGKYKGRIGDSPQVGKQHLLDFLRFFSSRLLAVLLLKLPEILRPWNFQFFTDFTY